MNHHRLIAGITAAVVILLAAVLIFHQQLGIPIGPYAPGTEVTTVEGPVQTTTGQVPEAIAPEFAFRRLEVDTSKPQAEACLVFTRTLDETGKTHYEDYLAFDPPRQIALRVTGDRVCIAGLAFNTTYTVTLKNGLPSARGESWSNDGNRSDRAARDRPPIVRFEGGILLPRDSVDGVPVTTVNIAKLKLKILRVGDRLLSQLETGVVDQTTIYGYDESQIESQQGSIVWQGTMDVAQTKNEAVVTLIPIRTLFAGRQARGLKSSSRGTQPNPTPAAAATKKAAVPHGTTSPSSG